MEQIPFDLKYQNKIESGEYLVKTRDGRSARIVCYDYKMQFGEPMLIVLVTVPVDDIYSYEEINYFPQSGRKISISESDDDLFLVKKDLKSILEKSFTNCFKNKGMSMEDLDEYYKDLEKMVDKKLTEIKPNEKSMTKGWIARDKSGYCGFYKTKPCRDKFFNRWVEMSSIAVPEGYFSDVQLEDEPVEATMNFKIKKSV